ncbi:hypothetical protein [Mesorhizobium sp. M0199]
MSETPKDKDQDKADQRRDDLAKRVLNTPPKHKIVNAPKPKSQVKQPK